MKSVELARIGFIAITFGGLSACGGNSATILTEGCRSIEATATPMSGSNSSVKIIDKRPLCDTPTPFPTLTDEEKSKIQPTPNDVQERATRVTIALTPVASGSAFPTATPLKLKK